MLRSGEVNVAGEVVEEFGAVLCEPREGAESALLQIFVRVEGGENHGFLVIEDTCAEIFGAAGFFFQLEELIENLAFGGVESATQRAVEAGERLAVFIEQAAQRFFVRIKAAGKRAREKFALHLLAEKLRAAENVADVEIEFREDSRDQEDLRA